MADNSLNKSYEIAKERYMAVGVDAEAAITELSDIPISLHCWQGDDVGGFEKEGSVLSGGGIQAIGNYPGKARNPVELRSDIEKVFSLIPGKHRLNLHAIYGDFGGKPVDRNEILPEHFMNWVAWAKSRKIGLDFNPTFFSHAKANDGFTLSSSDDGIRKFWIEHAIACRKIGEMFGKELHTPCVTNIWIPDGYKDITVDSRGPRERLIQSLDRIISEKINPEYNLDSVESKLFGIGSESFVVGSHEFYLGYALTRKILLCLDTGHFHPTEDVSKKITALMAFLDQAFLHVSRAVRWDSDHVVILNDELIALSQEIIRNGYQKRIHIGLDFFDASINRIAAWVIGCRCMIKALLYALLEPTKILINYEKAGDFTSRLAILEEMKTLPFGAVWDYYCRLNNVPAGQLWLDEVKAYERDVLSKRS